MRGFGYGLGVGGKIWLGPSALNPAAKAGAITGTMVSGANAQGADPTVGAGQGVGAWQSNGTSSAGTINGVNPMQSVAAALLPFPGHVSGNTLYMCNLSWQAGPTVFGTAGGPFYMFSLVNGPGISVNAGDVTTIKFPTHGSPGGQTFTMAAATAFVVNSPAIANRGGTWLFATTDTSAQAFNGLASVTFTLT